jgi:hypothetical protein
MERAKREKQRWREGAQERSNMREKGARVRERKRKGVFFLQWDGDEDGRAKRSRREEK